MHICVVGLRGIPGVIGGIETHCEQLYPRLRRLDNDIEVTLLIRQGYVEQRRFDYKGLQVRTVWSPRIWGVDTLIHTFLALVYARFVTHPRVMHLHGIGPGFFAPLSRAFGFLTVVTHHAPDYRRPKWGRRGRAFLKFGEFATARFASAVVCVSKAVREDFLEHHPIAAARTCAIRNGGSLPSALAVNSSTILARLGLEPHGYILAVGRLEGTKAFHELIAAFEKADPGRLKLVLAGSAAGNDEYAGSLMRHASERIRFAGFQSGDDLRRLYEEAALFVHPSHMEGFGLVVAEALSVNAPIVLSDIPPHREFGLNDDCYFPAGDVDALTRKLQAANYDMYKSPEASDRQREASWERAAQEHLALFRSLVSASEDSRAY
jgi:glycosyltransferase involved in cell wall biosynthesis